MSKTQIATGGLADNAVVTGKITDGTIATADIADDAVTAAKATGFGKIGQVVANHITTQTSSSSSTFAAAGGSETTIVTTASSSKVLLHISLSTRKSGNQYLALDLYRKIGDGSYSKIVDFENGHLYTNSTLIQTGRMAVSYLDEPSTAGTIKYKFQFNAGLNGASVVINPDGQETSSIILQEILA